MRSKWGHREQGKRAITYICQKILEPATSASEENGSGIRKTQSALHGKLTERILNKVVGSLLILGASETEGQESTPELRSSVNRYPNYNRTRRGLYITVGDIG